MGSGNGEHECLDNDEHDRLTRSAIQQQRWFVSENLH
jgi:hypothetical protein